MHAVLLPQDEQLNSACCDGRLEDARAVYEMGANPNWQDPRLVSYALCLINSVTNAN